MTEVLLVSLAIVVALLVALLVNRIAAQSRDVRLLCRTLSETLEEKHRGILVDLHAGLTGQGDRLGGHLTESSERLRGAVVEELRQARNTLHDMQLTLSESMQAYREAMVARLAETTQALNSRIDERLGEISGRVNERLEDGFRKTNETFTNVMTRLATIDEAQKKIESLTGSVVSLQELLGDKRARGAFGEVQLEALVRNVLPASVYRDAGDALQRDAGGLRARSAAADGQSSRGFEVPARKLPRHVRARHERARARGCPEAVQAGPATSHRRHRLEVHHSE
jgi:DNA recombination protein RmuC